SQTNRKRSVLLSCGRFDTCRRSTLSCWRRIRISATSFVLGLNNETMIWRISRRNSIITWQGYRVSASRLAESNFRYTQLYPRLLYRCTAAPLHRDPAKERWFSLLLPARLSRETPFQVIEIYWISAGLRCPPPCILRKSPCISQKCREGGQGVYSF